MNPSTCGFSRAGRDALCVAGIQIHQVDLIKRISRFPLALKNHAMSINAEIALTRPASFERQLASSTDEICFLSDRFGGIGFRDIRICCLSRRRFRRWK